MNKITISFVFFIISGYIISGFIWGFSGFGGIIAAIILYFASNTKESRVAKEMRESREKELTDSHSSKIKSSDANDIQ